MRITDTTSVLMKLDPVKQAFVTVMAVEPDIMQDPRAEPMI